ncbi:hypothetical protein L9G74_19120 [Shewanella sp. C32]|uniref:Uncharacterized protein n=1 Tax=Shewanella electrica TaxID=515560 RepID=A0ABT2FQC0_9GAMM|nr:hypothetical protein [Shewanella electrica]MCH1926859.1 hypothetical protein [Shewanella electrica]MCS4558552.1 hypothetical protein [Shewanella electrica]
MGLPVTVYRWDDDGAPQLPTSGAKPSEIIAILKACLVNGYGTKTPLGWSIPFENAVDNKIAFRNSLTEGSGGFVQFWDRSGIDSVNGILAFKSCQSMTALDAFFPDGSMGAINASNNMYKWVVIGTIRAFYLIIANMSVTTMAAGTYFSVCSFFGDYIPSINTDTEKFISSTFSLSDVTSIAWNKCMGGLEAGSWIFNGMYDTDGGGTRKQHYIQTTYPTSYSTARNTVSALGITVAQSLLKGGNDVTVSDRNGSRLVESIVQPFIRGAIPGLYQFAEIGYSNSLWPVIETVGDSNYWMIRQAHNGACCMAIKMDEW